MFISRYYVLTRAAFFRLLLNTFFCLYCCCLLSTIILVLSFWIVNLLPSLILLLFYESLKVYSTFLRYLASVFAFFSFFLSNICSRYIEYSTHIYIGNNIFSNFLLHSFAFFSASIFLFYVLDFLRCLWHFCLKLR